MNRLLPERLLQVILLLLLLLSPMAVAAQSSVNGDVNGDGEISIADVNLLVNAILNDYNDSRFDVNRDQEVSIADINTLINVILGNQATPDDGHEYVDLGLPSGTLWATCNIGASKPEEYGDYFAWGETEPKDYYEWSNYKWCNGSENTLTKYCSDSDYGYNGFVDNKTELDPEDDAAYVNWGASWRMPTVEQVDELIDNCTFQRVQRNGVVCGLITGPNGNTMYWPLKDHHWWENGGWDGDYGFWVYEWSCELWTRTLHPSRPDEAYNYGMFYVGADLDALEVGNFTDGLARCHVLAVRAVRVAP